MFIQKIDFDSNMCYNQITDFNLLHQSNNKLNNYFISKSSESFNSLRNFKISEIKEDFSTNLYKIIFTLENEINLGLESLENDGELVDSSLMLEEIIREYPEVSLRIAGSGSDLLSFVLPDSLLNLSFMKPGLEIISRIASLGGLFLAMSANGAQLAAVFCKHKMVQHSRELLNEYKSQLLGIPIQNRNPSILQSKTPCLNAEEKARAEKILKKWEVNLNNLDENLGEEKRDAGISTTFTSLYISLEVGAIVPLKFLPTYLKGLYAVIGAFGAIIIGIAANAVNFYKNSSKSKIFNDWKNEFQKWQKNSLVSLKAVNFVVQSSENLLEKRQNIVNGKMDLLRPQYEKLQTQIQERSRLIHKQLFSEISTKNSKDVEDHFQNWYEQQSKEKLLLDYIDRQETIELTLKNALKEIIVNKNNLENKFLKFDLYTSGIEFNVALVSFILTLVLSISAALSIPVSGIGILILATSIAPAALTLGFIAASLLLSRILKPNTTKAKTSFLTFKMAWSRINKAIGNYRHKAKLKKLQEVALSLYQLHYSNMKKTDPAAYKNALTRFKKAKKKFDQSKVNEKKWERNIRKFERTLTEKAWEDYASLTNSKVFNSLTAFSSALKECNINLLSGETRYLLETQLGLDLETLQKKLIKDPGAIQAALTHFAALNTDDFLNFINKQSTYIKANFIPSS